MLSLTPNERVGITDQERVDVWFDRAMNDRKVRPYLTTGRHTPRISIPEDDYDGAVVMSECDTGLMKLYFEEETQTAKMGIWVLTPDDGKPRNTAISIGLICTAIELSKQNSLVNYMATRVMDTNHRGMRFSKFWLGDPWGTEQQAVFDTSHEIESRTGGWSNWCHFRASIPYVEEQFWELSRKN